MHHLCQTNKSHIGIDDNLRKVCYHCCKRIEDEKFKSAKRASSSKRSAKKVLDGNKAKKLRVSKRK